MAKATVAVLQFPGTNCEYETIDACRGAGLEAELFRWNLPAENLRDYAAFILPGGFSYQDRIRAGSIAARKPLLATLIELADEGRPILGICNGAQVLVESGLVPDLTGKKEVQMSLAVNYVAGRTGYYCAWTTCKIMVDTAQSPFLCDFQVGETLPIPIAHGEGRFVTKNEQVIEQLDKNGQIALCYSTAEGEIVDAFPVNPNGATANIAGLTNPAGNVLAMMPHPERAARLLNLPETYDHPWCRKRLEQRGSFDRLMQQGPGARFFTSLARYLSTHAVAAQ